jgi:hypothetical protein
MWTACLLTLLCAPTTEDLAERYPGRLDWVQNGLPWTCGPEDVWRLASFELSFGREFELTAGKCELVLGQHEGNVLWAVLFPEKPAKLRAKGQPGDGVEARTILLRFAPAEIGRVFPPPTVKGPGDAWRRAEADRIFRKKIGHKWFTPAGNPTIVQPGFTLVDLDTTDGKRRFYELDGNAAKLTYVPAFEEKPVRPDANPVTKTEAERAFDEVWEAFDREYANFGLLPELDWKKHGAEHKKRLARVKSRFELGAVLADMLAALEDLHVWVQAGEDWLPGYARVRPLNGSWKGSLAVAGGELTDTKKDLVWTRARTGAGYLNVHSLGDPGLPPEFDEALEALADAPELVLDLRFNGGGDETLAQKIAGRFTAERRLYSKNRYRSGPKHDDLGAVLERTFEPRGPWPYEKPVIVLQGERTMSSAESFVLMLAQCPNVTTMGSRTAGSSANPRRLELTGGIVVNLPRWHDMDPEGRPIEHAGVKPDVELAFPAEEYREDHDPLLAAALERLARER